jgi:dolichyl-phosphate-mannose--protein O-mannosyl transferase
VNSLKTFLLSFLFFASNALAATTVSADGIIGMVIWIVVIGLVFWLLWFLIGYAGIPEPFNKVIRVVLMVIAVLILINFLLSFAGHPIVNFR